MLKRKFRWSFPAKAQGDFEMKKFIAVAVLAVAAVAAKAEKTSIKVHCLGGGDIAGQGVCTSLRDSIASNPRYELITSAPSEFTMVLTINPESAEDSAVGLVLIHRGTYVTSTASIVHPRSSKLIADTLWTSMDQAITEELSRHP
jgi:hypothetical protein